MKNLILIYLERPDLNDRAKQASWSVLLGNLDMHRTPEVQTGRIGDNSWLLDRENDVSVLAHVVTNAQALGIAYRVHFLSEDCS